MTFASTNQFPCLQKIKGRKPKATTRITGSSTTIDLLTAEWLKRIRDKVGQSVANNTLATEQIGDSDADNAPTAKAKSSFSAFSALSTQDDGPPEVDENEDFGGLMVRLGITFEIYYNCHTVA